MTDPFNHEEQRDNVPGELTAQETSHELVKLVRKLRWIGLDDEARCIQHALCAIPASKRASVLSWPTSTD